MVRVSGRDKEASMATVETIKLEKMTKRLEVRTCCLEGSSFVDVNLSKVSFDDINFSGADIHNANMSDWVVRDANLKGLKITSADLRGAAISHSLTEGMTVDGIAVSEMMAAYRELKERG
jgi:uncharacterized protein YjbI with pentapeptide repeats